MKLEAFAHNEPSRHTEAINNWLKNMNTQNKEINVIQITHSVGFHVEPATKQRTALLSTQIYYTLD